VTIERVRGLREILGEHITVTPLDKGGKQLYVECDILYNKRLAKLAVDADEFLLMEGTVEVVLAEMKKDYEDCGMELIADWNEKEEVVPPAVAMPKHKAPEEKSRLVNSYAKGGARVALKRVSKALTWIFKQTSARFRGFTLLSVRDAKRMINEGNKELLNGAGKGWKMLLEQQDVVNMFTNLGKEEIRIRVYGVLDEAEKLIQGRSGKRKEVTLVMLKGEVLEVKWGSDRTNDENIVLSFEQIKVAVDFDLAHNFCGVGQRVLQQMGGCPIGGLLSALYANIYCAHDERAFCKRWSKLAGRFYGVRQMDDLLLVMRWDEDEESQMEMVELRDDARARMYTGGPESEIEYKIDWMGEKTRVWSGLQLRVGETGVICKTHNKNEESIRLRGVQDLPRYAPGYSYQTENMREGLMLGNGRRLRDQCTLDEDFLECLELDYRECLLIGTPREVVMQALKRLPQYTSGTKREWEQEKAEIRKKLKEYEAQ
jgi:hypothetical protein